MDDASMSIASSVEGVSTNSSVHSSQASVRYGDHVTLFCAQHDLFLIGDGFCSDVAATMSWHNAYSLLDDTSAAVFEICVPSYFQAQQQLSSFLADHVVELAVGDKAVLAKRREMEAQVDSELKAVRTSTKQSRGMPIQMHGKFLLRHVVSGRFLSTVSNNKDTVNALGLVIGSSDCVWFCTSEVSQRGPVNYGEACSLHLNSMAGCAVIRSEKSIPSALYEREQYSDQWTFCAFQSGKFLDSAASTIQAGDCVSLYNRESECILVSNMEERACLKRLGGANSSSNSYMSENEDSDSTIFEDFALFPAGSCFGIEASEVAFGGPIFVDTDVKLRSILTGCLFGVEEPKDKVKAVKDSDWQNVISGAVKGFDVGATVAHATDAFKDVLNAGAELVSDVMHDPVPSVINIKRPELSLFFTDSNSQMGPKRHLREFIGLFSSSAMIDSLTSVQFTSAEEDQSESSSTAIKSTKPVALRCNSGLYLIAESGLQEDKSPLLLGQNVDNNSMFQLVKVPEHVAYECRKVQSFKSFLQLFLAQVFVEKVITPISSSNIVNLITKMETWVSEGPSVVTAWKKAALGSAGVLDDLIQIIQAPSKKCAISPKALVSRSRFSHVHKLVISCVDFIYTCVTDYADNGKIVLAWNTVLFGIMTHVSEVTKIIVECYSTNIKLIAGVSSLNLSSILKRCTSLGSKVRFWNALARLIHAGGKGLDHLQSSALDYLEDSQQLFSCVLDDKHKPMIIGIDGGKEVSFSILCASGSMSELFDATLTVLGAICRENTETSAHLRSLKVLPIHIGEAMLRHEGCPPKIKATIIDFLVHVNIGSSLPNVTNAPLLVAWASLGEQDFPNTEILEEFMRSFAGLKDFLLETLEHTEILGLEPESDEFVTSCLRTTRTLVEKGLFCFRMNSVKQFQGKYCLKRSKQYIASQRSRIRASVRGEMQHNSGVGSNSTVAKNPLEAELLLQPIQLLLDNTTDVQAKSHVGRRACGQCKVACAQLLEAVLNMFHSARVYRTLGLYKSDLGNGLVSKVVRAAGTARPEHDSVMAVTNLNLPRMLNVMVPQISNEFLPESSISIFVTSILQLLFAFPDLTRHLSAVQLLVDISAEQFYVRVSAHAQAIHKNIPRVIKHLTTTITTASSSSNIDKSDSATSGAPVLSAADVFATISNSAMSGPAALVQDMKAKQEEEELNMEQNQIQTAGLSSSSALHLSDEPHDTGISLEESANLVSKILKECTHHCLVNRSTPNSVNQKILRALHFHTHVIQLLNEIVDSVTGLPMFEILPPTSPFKLYVMSMITSACDCLRALCLGNADAQAEMFDHISLFTQLLKVCPSHDAAARVCELLKAIFLDNRQLCIAAEQGAIRRLVSILVSKRGYSCILGVLHALIVPGNIPLRRMQNQLIRLLESNADSVLLLPNSNSCANFGISLNSLLNDPECEFTHYCGAMLSLVADIILGRHHATESKIRSLVPLQDIVFSLFSNAPMSCKEPLIRIAIQGYLDVESLPSGVLVSPMMWRIINFASATLSQDAHSSSSLQNSDYGLGEFASEIHSIHAGSVVSLGDNSKQLGRDLCDGCLRFCSLYLSKQTSIPTDEHDSLIDLTQALSEWVQCPRAIRETALRTIAITMMRGIMSRVQLPNELVVICQPLVLMAGQSDSEFSNVQISSNQDSHQADKILQLMPYFIHQLDERKSNAQASVQELGEKLIMSKSVHRLLHMISMPYSSMHQGDVIRFRILEIVEYVSVRCLQSNDSDMQQILPLKPLVRNIISLISKTHPSTGLQIQLQATKLLIKVLELAGLAAQEAVVGIAQTSEIRFMPVLHRLLEIARDDTRDFKSLMRQAIGQLSGSEAKSWKLVEEQIGNAHSLAGSVDILKLLQFLCEGHFTAGQNMLREQESSITSVNLVSQVALLLSEAQADLAPPTLPVVQACLSTLIDCVQGPCRANQAILMKSKVVDACVKIMHLATSFEKESGEKIHFEDNFYETIRKLKQSALIMLQGLVEGASAADPGVPQALISLLDFDAFSNTMRTCWHEAEEESNKVVIKGLRTAETIERMNLNREIFFQCGVFLKQLEVFDTSGSVAQHLKSLLSKDHKLQKQFNNTIRSIEVQLGDGSLVRNFFRAPGIVQNVSKSMKKELLWTIDRETDLSKLEDFVHSADDLRYEAAHQFAIRSGPITNAIVKAAQLVKLPHMLNILLMNCLMLIFFKYDSKTAFQISPSFKNAYMEPRMYWSVRWLLLLFQIVMEGLLALEYMLVTAPRYVRKQWKQRTIDEGVADRISLLKDTSLRAGSRYRGVYFWGTSLWFFFKNPILFWRFFSFIICLSVFANINAPDEYVLILGLLMFEIFLWSSTLRSVLGAVSYRFSTLIQTVAMGLVFLFWFGLLGFVLFPDKFQFRKAEVQNSNTLAQELNTRAVPCDTVWVCVLMVVDMGLRTEDIGDGIDKFEWPLGNEGLLDWPTSKIFLRILYTFLFFVLVTTIIMQIIFGVIVDSFKTLRENDEAITQDITSRCFICGLPRSVFTASSAKGYEHHVRNEHHMWDYMSFIIHLLSTDDSEYNGVESYVASKIAEGDVSFFPIGQTTCLKSHANSSLDSRESAQADTFLQSFDASLASVDGLQMQLSRMRRGVDASSNSLAPRRIRERWQRWYRVQSSCAGLLSNQSRVTMNSG